MDTVGTLTINLKRRLDSNGHAPMMDNGKPPIIQFPSGIIILYGKKKKKTVNQNIIKKIDSYKIRFISI